MCYGLFIWEAEGGAIVSERERQSGFNKGEVRCTCGATFDTVQQLLDHAETAHVTQIQ